MATLCVRLVPLLVCSLCWFTSVDSSASCDVEERTTLSATASCELLDCSDRSPVPDVSVLWTTDWLKGILCHIKESNCRTQIEQMLHSLRNHDLWAVKMMDANGRVPSQLLSGNSHQLGDYDQCLTSGHTNVQPQYCLALMDVTAAATAPHTIKHVVRRVRGNNFMQSHRGQSGHFAPTYTTIKWGLCLPFACAPSALSDAFNIFFNQTLPSYVTVQGTINDIHCKQGALKDTREGLLENARTQNEWLLTTYFGTLLLCGVVAISLLSTYLDQNPQDVPLSGKLEELRVFCSLKGSWRQFFEIKKEDIGCIHGVRTIATFMLFVAHNVIPLASIPFVNRTSMAEIMSLPFSSVFRSSIVYTDTFLYLSGLLSSYYLQSSSSIFTRFGNRLLRMFPLQLVVIAFTGYVLPYLGSGPLWSYIVESNGHLCVDYGWRNLIFIQNFFPFEQMCAPHTHHLALDMQLFVITIPVVIGLKTYPVAASLVIVVSNLTCAALRYQTVLHHRISFVIHTGVSMQDLYKAADVSYIHPLHRATPYLSGLWLGYLLYKIKCQPVKLSRRTLYTGWSMTFLCIAYCLMANYQAGASNYSYDVIAMANYAALQPLLTSLSLTWIILVCSTGYGGSLNSFLSSRVMCLLSKMSFSIYLVQFCIFFYKLGTIRTSRAFTIWYLLPLEELFLVTLSSFALTLFVDIPSQNLKYLIFR